MRQVCIYNRQGWTVVSYGGGLSYALTRVSDGMGAWFHGDDATEFREGMEAAFAYDDRVMLDFFGEYEGVMSKME